MAMASLGQGITDIDNNFYDTIRIGTQTWFARNLQAIRLNDGTPIPNVTAQANWAAQTSPAFCWYNNETANRDIYGALYNGFAVKTGKLCPTGWHVPTEDDWSDLVLFLGGPTVAAGKLKATGTANWQSPNVGATNQVGFSALPGGYRPSDNFFAVGVFGFWWSSTEYETGRAWTQTMRHDEPGMMAPAGLDFGNGLSVRCIKDLSIPCVPSEGTHVVSSCSPYVWIDGNTYTTSNNTATFKLTNKAGCDSLVRLSLTIGESTSATQVVSACDSYTWIDGNTYTTSTTSPVFKLVNKAGCDSLVRLNLAIRVSTSATQVVSACDSYTWIDGNTYTASTNTSTFKLVNKAGCDSLIRLNLTIKSALATVTSSGTFLVSELVGSSYQWFDCATNNSIGGATSQSFQPTMSGTYRVEVMHDGCKRVSSCAAVVITDLADAESDKPRVYPNPVRDFLYVEFDRAQSRTLTIYDAVGAELVSLEVAGKSQAIDVRHLPRGLFVLKIQTQGKTDFVRFINSRN